MDGFYIGKAGGENSKITLIDYEKFNRKSENNFPLGIPGTGRNFFIKYQGMIAALENYVVENHLNNNNWLKQHGKPMIRREHKHYKLTKRLKKEKPMKIIIIDPEKEYEELNELISKKTNLDPTDTEVIIMN